MSTIQCGQCGRPLDIPAGAEGQPVRCPQCGSMNLVGELPAGQVPGAIYPSGAIGPQPWAMPYASSASASSAKALASMLLGITGLVMWCCPLVGPVIGLVLGIQARKGPGRGKAIAGIILCIIAILLTLVFAAVTIYLQHKGGQLPVAP